MGNIAISDLPSPARTWMYSRRNLTALTRQIYYYPDEYGSTHTHTHGGDTVAKSKEVDLNILQGLTHSQSRSTPPHIVQHLVGHSRADSLYLHSPRSPATGDMHSRRCSLSVSRSMSPMPPLVCAKPQRSGGRVSAAEHVTRTMFAWHKGSGGLHTSVRIQ